MARKYPQDIVEQAQVVADAWGKINPQLAFGDLNQAGLVDQLNSVRSTENEIVSLENTLTNLRNERDAAYEVIWDYVKRSRVGMKAFFGDDSPQYELVGGTRLSDRKPNARKTTVA